MNTMYKHPLVATLLLSFLSLTALATDRYVDPSIWPATLPNYYMTVTQALNAAQSGDRIFIAPGAYATPAITISQDIEIYSMDTTDVVNLYSGSLSSGTTITINGIANMQVKMSGFSCGAITINGATDMQVEGWKLRSIGGLYINGGVNMSLKMDSIQFVGLWLNGGQGMHYVINRADISGSITIYGSTNMDVNLTNFNNYSNSVSLYSYGGMKCLFSNFATGSMVGYTVTNGSNSNRAKINLIDCVISNGDLNFDDNYYELNCIHTSVPNNNIRLRYGNIVASKTKGLFVNDELGGGNVADTISKILIAADTIGILNYANDNYRFIIANNLLGSLMIHSWNWYVGNINRVINNEFASSVWTGPFSTKILVADNAVPFYNLDFSNNILQLNLVFRSGGNSYYCSNGTQIPGTFGSQVFNGISFNEQNNYVSFSCGYENFYNGIPNCPFPNRDAPGFFKWTYNGFAIPGTGSLPGNLTFINTPGTNNTVNAGNPAPEYTDIDLSRNDRGRLGGPYSILNYNPANPNNSKAFIFDLDIPTQFNPASPSINIQAKGYHRN
jgi:hypothetical protein